MAFSLIKCLLEPLDTFCINRKIVELCKHTVLLKNLPNKTYVTILQFPVWYTSVKNSDSPYQHYLSLGWIHYRRGNEHTSGEFTKSGYTLRLIKTNKINVLSGYYRINIFILQLFHFFLCFLDMPY